MSASAADLLHVDRHELTRFLTDDDNRSDQPFADGIKVEPWMYEPLGGDGQVIHLTFATIAICLTLVLSAFVLVAGLVICWSTNKRRKLYETQQQQPAPETPYEQPTDVISKPSPLVPQTYGGHPLDGAKQQSEIKEELWKLKVEKCDVTAGFDNLHNKLQVKVRRITFADFSDILTGSVYTNFMVAVQLDNGGAANYFESKIRPLQGENLFEEPHEFDVTMDQLSQNTLKVAIYVTDRYSQHRLVQQYHYRMASDIDTQAIPDGSDGIILPVTLSPVTVEDDGLGIRLVDQVPKPEISFSLCYMPTSGRLTVVMLSGRHISPASAATDCKYTATLLVGGNMVKTVESSSSKKTPSPVFNEAFVFHIPLERVQDTELVINLALEDLAGATFGKVVAGATSMTEVGRQHWSEMMSVPRHPVAQWHTVATTAEHI